MTDEAISGILENDSAFVLTYRASDGTNVSQFNLPVRTVLTNLGLDWVWDDGRLPDWWWANLDRQEDGEHWVLDPEAPQMKGYYPYAFLARRLLDVSWRQVSSVTPTCGVERCVNPSHLWVTLKEGERP